MNKQLNLLYFSATGTTAKVVKEIAAGIGGGFKEYDITMPLSRENGLNFGSDDLVIVGVPVYAGRVPSFLTDYFSRVKGSKTSAIFVVVYGNRDYDDALLELKDTFEGNGFIGIAGGAFIGEHSNTRKVGTNRPDAEDLKIAGNFGSKISDKLGKAENTLHTKGLIVKGNFPYKEKAPKQPIAPETNENCTNCGICAKNCPMGAIDFSDYKNVDASKCIRCSSCVKRCPVNAKAINNEFVRKFTERLIENFASVRHEPELFI
jgi:ferredoxin